MQVTHFDTDFLPARVARFAIQKPAATALVDADGPLAWGALWAWSGRLAAALAAQGVRPGERVALALPRSASLVAGILAAWRLRACYVPLDPALPAARLGWQAQDCGARAVLAADALDWLPAGVPVVDPQATRSADGGHGADPMPGPDDGIFVWPAYVIYTSGSSGRPKGVVLSHGALSAYLRGVGERLPADIGSAAYLSTPAADLGHTSLFGALWHGWTLHLIDAQVATDPDAFGAYMSTHAVDLLKIVPSHLDALLQAQAPDAVLPRRCLLIGGEPAPTRLAERIAQLRPECRLINHYGPTETAVGVLTRDGGESRGATLPLGTPLAHVHARIVDADGNPAPKGATGELCIGGASVADGYLNRPSLTAERFVPDPDGHGARLYRTGDRSRRLPNGEFTFLGRLDDQVKIRGYRVEPEEIAARLRAEAGVRDAVVIARADGEAGPLRLLAYVTGSVPLDADALRARLAADLPDYMVPAALQVLDALPLTANGKVDRAALPEPAGAVDAAAHVAPRNDAERTLAEIWQVVLGREAIGVTDNFFALGGDSIHSLKIITKARRAGLKLTPKQMFEHPTIEAAVRVALASAAPASACAPASASASAAVGDARAAASAPQDLAPASPDDAAWFAQAGVTRDTADAVYPATPMQQGLLFHGMLDNDPGLYISQLRLTIGALRLDAMRAAWDAVVARHPILRTRFVWPAGGEPLQVVERHARVPFDVHDAAADASSYEAGFAAARDAIVARGFDPAVAPLMRIDVFARPDGAHDVLWTHHHALTDGWSTAQVATDVARAYGELTAGRAADATPGARYADYVHWLRRQPDTGAFWRARLATLDEPARLADALGGDFPPHAAAGASVEGVVARAFDAARHARLTRAAQHAQVTLNTVVQGAWALVLAHLSGRRQVVFGTTVSGRPVELPDAQTTVGLFINSLPLWVDVASGTPLAAWLGALQNRNAELREVEHTPLASLQQWAGLSGDALFDSLVVFENFPLDEALGASRDALGVRSIAAYNRTHLPLTLVVAPRHLDTGAEGLALEWRWDAARLAERGIVRVADYFDRVIDRLAAALDTPHACLRDLAGDDAPTAGAAASFRFASVTARIAAQVAARPDATAVSFTGDDGAAASLTYRQLDRASARVANACRAALTARGERRVGIAMSRTPALVTAVLGVLRAGAAYVPLDPAYPDDRLRGIALDAGLDALIVTNAERARFAALLPGVALLDAEPFGTEGAAPDDAIENAFADPHPEQLAYVIYTSGSTGVPKGVGVTHANVARLFDATQARFRFDERDVWTLFHSYAFDFSVWEIFGALVHGGRLVIVPHWTAREPAAFHALLRDERVTVLNQTPSAFVQLTQADPDNTLDTLRAVVFGGERLDPASIARWADGARARGVLPALVNMYGITETTVHVTHRDLDEAALREARSVIGAPLDDLTLQVLDGDLNRVPVGAVGEMYVGGAGLARGYLGRPGLTAERFVPNPFGEPGSRLYRSGDLARRLTDGDLEYLGRNDHQVKIRGFRIELGEIQAALLAHPEVRDAAVLVVEGAEGDKRLAAYVVPAGEPGEGNGARWQGWLSERLPSHMVPSSYVELARFPLTPNGKLDRRALPAPEQAAAGRAAFVAPQGPAQTRLAAIWQDVLGAERVGAHDDFFQLGGHSLLAVRVISAVRTAFGHAPALRAVFEHPVLADFAATLNVAPLDAAATSARTEPEAVTDPAAPMPLSAPQERLWFLWKLDPHSAAYHVNGALRFDGRLDVDALRDAFADLGDLHPALRMRFGEDGGVPYQRIDLASRSAMRVLDLRDVAGDGGEAALVARLAERVREPFDLTAEPPVRATLIRVAADRHVLHLVLHHIVSDDGSVGLLFADFSRLYRDRVAGAQPADAGRTAAIAAYRRLMASHAAHLTPEREAGQLAYWRDALAGDGDPGEPLALPFDRIRTGARRAPGARLHAPVSAATATALRTLSSTRHATLFMTMLAAFNTLLYRYAGQRDVRVGVPLAGRDLPGAADVVGFFVNTVVIRTEPRGAMRADALIDAVRERLLAAHAHQDVPFASVVKAVQPERDLTQTPLFQVLVNQQQRHALERAFGDALRVTVQEVDNGEAQFDLMLNIAETAEAGLDLTFTYASDVFEAATIERLARNFVGLLDQWSVAPHALLASFELPDTRDEGARGAAAAWPAPLDVAARFAAQAARDGDAVAISDGGEPVTYAQLDAWSRAIAAQLRRHGVTAETRVGVSMQRSAALVASLLGVLRAGAAYVPLDPSYPPERLAHILADAELKSIVTDADSLAQHAALFAQRPTLDAAALRGTSHQHADEGECARPHPEQLAYVIYTSGSTGVPKGVGVTHANVARLFDATQARFRFDERDVWTLFHSYAFDFSVWEIFGALVHGGRLVIVPHWTAREPAAFHALLRDEKVTVLNQTPSAFVQLTQADPGNTLDTLRAVVFGGERLDPASIARWADGARARGVLPALVNMYGIT
ncbi:non-ribosomal peptide synthetase, partial [Burkholderia alba]|uniref:non-ribosomal peptide synthetase n=1 Tax=Burkholderia alba TaxID=2683677 RepID=UPI002B057C85